MYEPHVIYTNIPEAKNEGKIKKKKKSTKMCYYLQEVQYIFFSSNDHTKLSWCYFIFKKYKTSYKKEFQSHCSQFYKMREKKVLR